MKPTRHPHQRLPNHQKMVPGMLVLLLLWASGCGMLNTYQTGRVVEAKSSILATSLNFAVIPDGTDTLRPYVWPTEEFMIRHGIGSHMDIGLRGRGFFNYQADFKYQFLGNATSHFAGSTGFGVEFIPNTNSILGNFAFHLPLYLSYHPSEKYAFYISPRYSYQIQEFRHVGYSVSGSIGFGYRLRPRTLLMFETGYQQYFTRRLPFWEWQGEIGAGLVFELRRGNN